MKMVKQDETKGPFADWERVDTHINNIKLHLLKGDNKISEEEYLTLMRMNNSPDQENKTVVDAIVEIKDKDEPQDIIRKKEG